MKLQSPCVWLLLLLMSNPAAAAPVPALGTAPAPATAPAAPGRSAVKLVYRPGRALSEEQAFPIIADLVSKPHETRVGLRGAFNLMRARDGHLVFRRPNDPTSHVEMFEGRGDAPMLVFAAGNPEAAALFATLVADLQKAVAETASLSDEQVAQQYPDVEQELLRVHEMQRQIEDLTQSRAKVQQEIVAEKLKALELEKQRLEMDLAAKKARGDALRQQIREILASATSRPASGDAVIEQLAKSVKTRQEALDRMHKLHEQGMTSAAELSQAEEAVLDAKAKLAERQDLLAQPANPELIGRLTEEVALVAVDQAELAARLQEVTRRLPPDDFSKITEKDLIRLSPDYFGLGTPGVKRPPLLAELENKERQLQRRLLALSLAEVKVVEAPPPTTEPSRSQGGGF